MAVPDRYHFTAPTADQLGDVLRLDSWAVPDSVSVDDRLAIPSPVAWERAVGIVADETDDLPADLLGSAAGELAAFHTTIPLRAYPVPGAEIACGWLTWVGVHPAHRRRGLLRAMIERQFADCVAAGEPVAALFAAEPGIYGRFGFGMAATDLRVTVPRGAPLRDVTGSAELTAVLREWDADAHGQLVADLHRAAGRAPAGYGRPGWATWETPGLRASRDSDPGAYRGGKETRRLLLVLDADSQPRGFATFRRSTTWERSGPKGSVEVRDMVALDAAAVHRLWSVLLDIDLTTDVKAGYLAVDDPITELLVDLRAAVPDYQDNTWLRLIDLPAALAARRYVADVDVVLEVTDAMLPANAGRWRVTAQAWGPATVTRTDDPAHITVDIRDLGAAYLGGTSLVALSAAGLVTVTDPHALRSAAVAFGWPVAPVCSWAF